MKNIFNRFVFLIAFCGLFVSCSNFSTSFYNEVDISKGKGKICISTDLQASRSVLPTAITDTTTGLKWELNGTKDDTTKTIKSWVDDANGTTAYKKVVADTSIFVDVGEWKFTLTASTAGKNVLNATISATINAGENSLNFEMQEAIGENAATGSIEFTLNFPKEVVDKAIATLYKYGNADAAVDTNRQLTIDESSNNNFDSVKYSYPSSTNSTTAELKSGYYILKIELQQSNGSTTAPTEEYKTINTYSCLVRVAPGLTSKGEYTLDKLAQLYTVTYEGNGGIFDSATTVTTSYNAYTSLDLPTLKKDGYEFAGWYTDSNFAEGTNVSGPYKLTQDTTLYAKWKISWDGLKKQIENDSGISEIVITNDLTATSTITVNKPINIIAESPVTITRGNTTDGANFTDTFFKVEISGNLELEGKENSTITLDGGSKNETSIKAEAPLITSSGNLTITNCILQNNTNNTDNGGGVCIFGGELIMNEGATISTCTSLLYGGGVVVYGSEGVNSGAGGTFNMAGGTISGCSAEQGGGGVCVQGGTFTMENNSLISKNTSGGNGGGIFADGGSITIKGGSISENIFSNNSFGGGGIYLIGTAQLIMTGGEISGNSAYYGGGIHISGESSKFAMKGGEISGNSAEYGGGVAVDGLFFMSGGTISGNKVTNNSNGSGSGSGVYVAYIGNSQSAATFEMSGGAVISLNNDVYLANGTTITVTGNLTSTDTVATITPNEYSINRQVITVPVSTDGTTSSVTLSDQVGKFAVTPQVQATTEETINWTINANGFLSKEAVYYVGNNENDNPKGTETSPFATLQAAVDMVNSINDGTSSYTIYVMSNITWKEDLSGTNNSSDFINIPPTNSLNLKICGYNNQNVTIDAQQKGRVMYIGKNANVTLQNLILTGGYLKDEKGAGLYILNSTAEVTIKNCEISENVIDNGYGAGLCVGYLDGESLNLTIEKSKISNNTIKHDSTGASSQTGAGIAIENVEANITIKDSEITGNKINQEGIVNSDTIPEDKGVGLWLGNKAETTISGSTISENIIENAASNNKNAGGGICIEGGTLTMTGGAVISSNNDVYLANGTSIKVTGNLTGTTPVATITPEKYEVGIQVLTAESGVTLAEYVGKFAVTPQVLSDGHENWFVDLYGYLGKVPETETNNDGTVVYLMESYDNLLWIAQELKTGSITSFNIKLTNDIEIPSGKWTSPLDVTNASTIDGEGHSIKFNGGSGLFERFHEGSIENLVLEGTINTSSYQNHHNGHCGVGVLAGSTYKTTIKNVVSTVNVVDTGDGYVGGLIGYFGGNSNMNENQPGSFIQNCAVYANITSTNGTVGGLVGGTWANAQCWQINNCIYKGNVTGGTDQGVGAIIGTHNTGRKSTFKDTWYCANGTSEIVGKYNNDGNGVNFDGYDTVISKTADQIASEAAATLLNTTSDGTVSDIWEYVSGDYPTLKSVN